MKHKQKYTPKSLNNQEKQQKKNIKSVGSSHTILSGPPLTFKAPHITHTLSIQMVLSTPLTISGYNVFEVLLWYFFNMPRVYVCQSTLARILGISREHVCRLTSDLQRMGWISKKQYGMNTPCLYGLNKFFRSPSNLEAIQSIFRNSVDQYIGYLMGKVSWITKKITLQYQTALQWLKNKLRIQEIYSKYGHGASLHLLGFAHAPPLSIKVNECEQKSERMTSYESDRKAVVIEGVTHYLSEREINEKNSFTKDFFDDFATLIDKEVRPRLSKKDRIDQFDENMSHKEKVVDKKKASLVLEALSKGLSHTQFLRLMKV